VTQASEAIAPSGGKSAEEELFLLRLRYKEGRLVEAGANRPFLLDDPSLAWVVYSGKVDIFIVSLNNGEPQGSRRHLLRLDSGQAAFGLEKAAYGTGVALLAVGTSGTRVLRVPRARLQEYAANPLHRDEVLAMVDSWVGLLAQAIATSLPPKGAQLLNPDAAATLDTGESASARREPVWVRARDGGLTYLGQANLGIAPGEVRIPLTRNSWVETLDAATVDAVSTAAWVAEDPEWTSIDRFHALAMGAIRRAHRERAIAEIERLEQKAATDKRSVSQSLTRLASVLEAPRALEFVADDTDTPVFAAARLVGQATGMTMRQHPDALHGKHQVDPLSDIARASRAKLRTVKLTADWWRKDNGPLLAYTAGEAHPVALLPTSARSYRMVDPAARTSAPVTAEVAATLSPDAFMFYRPFPNAAVTAWKLLRFGSHGSKSDLIMILLMGLAGGALVTLVPIVTSTLFDSIIPSGEKQKLLAVTGALLIGALASLMFELTRGVAVLRLAGRMDASVQAAVWDRLLSLPVPFFRNYSTGELSTRALGINSIRQILTGAAVSSILGVIFSVFNVGLLFYYNVRLAIMGVGLVLAILGVTLLLSYQQVRQRRPLIDLQGKISGVVVEMLTGIAKLRVTGAEGRAFAVWARRFTEQRQITFKARSTGNTLLVFTSMAPVLTTMSIFALVAYGLNNGMSSGAFLGFFAAFSQFLAAMVSMNTAVITVLNVVPVFEQMTPILTALPEIDTDKSDPGELTGDVEVSHVSFRYNPDGPLVLDDVSLKVNPGEFVAIVGPSGSGKSSLLRLLLKFEEPEAGSIYYDGQDLGGLDVQAVRRQIGVVLQHSKLMSGALWQNIAGSTGRTIDDAWEAARLAGLEDDIHRMPMGMHTHISPGAATFSGGQRQRLMIARAIVTRPRILIFDEATSALDSRTQEQVSKSLEGLQATRLVIAHRLSTIVNADRIYVIQAGKVVQNGTYQQLLNQPGPFAELVRRQLA
jgi:NHLM bacteriocin system ABC transporter ATP-binding protein